MMAPHEFKQAHTRSHGSILFRIILMVSLLAHMVIIAVWMELPQTPAPPPQADAAISVTLAAPPQKRPQVPRAAAPTPVPPAEPIPPESPPSPVAPLRPLPPEPADSPPPMISPKTMLASKSLNGKRSAAARASMKQLAPDERLIQLCNIEAMEQVAAWKPVLKPQQLVAYALADPDISGDTIHAAGAAILVNKQWFRLEYQCAGEVLSNRVLSFSFRLGDVIPQDEQIAHNLSSAGDDLDP